VQSSEVGCVLRTLFALFTHSRRNRMSQSPIRHIHALAHKPMKGQIRPVQRASGKATLDRIPMDVIDMPRKIGIIADLMLPEPSLSQIRFVALGARWRDVLDAECIVASPGNGSLDHRPTHRKIRIVLRQRPGAMQMVRQENPGIDLERRRQARSPGRFAQCIAHRCFSQYGNTAQCIDRKEVRPTRDIGTSIVRHALQRSGVRSAHRFGENYLGGSIPTSEGEMVRGTHPRLASLCSPTRAKTSMSKILLFINYGDEYPWLSLLIKMESTQAGIVTFNIVP